MGKGRGKRRRTLTEKDGGGRMSEESEKESE
jgi:hypothetical protein